MASDMLDQINPAIPAVHYESAAGPTECLTLLGQDFKSLIWEAVAVVPTYNPRNKALGLVTVASF